MTPELSDHRSPDRSALPKTAKNWKHDTTASFLSGKLESKSGSVKEFFLKNSTSRRGVLKTAGFRSADLVSGQGRAKTRRVRGILSGRLKCRSCSDKVGCRAGAKTRRLSSFLKARLNSMFWEPPGPKLDALGPFAPSGREKGISLRVSLLKLMCSRSTEVVAQKEQSGSSGPGSRPGPGPVHQ